MDIVTTSPRDVLRWMLDDEHLSAYGLSQRLGRSRNWTYNTLGRDPKLSTVAAVAAVTGHEVAILDAGTGDVVATITPPDVQGDHEGEGEDA